MYHASVASPCVSYDNKNHWSRKMVHMLWPHFKKFESGKEGDIMFYFWDSFTIFSFSLPLAFLSLVLVLLSRCSPVVLSHCHFVFSFPEIWIFPLTFGQTPPSWLISSSQRFSVLPTDLSHSLTRLSDSSLHETSASPVPDIQPTFIPLSPRFRSRKIRPHYTTCIFRVVLNQTASKRTHCPSKYD